MTQMASPPARRNRNSLREKTKPALRRGFLLHYTSLVRAILTTLSVLLLLAHAQSGDFSEASGQLEFRFKIESQTKMDFTVVKTIEVWNRGTKVQTISFEGNSELPTTPKGKKPIRFEDVDCDGFKDLLVHMTQGVHGDSWYELFRYRPESERFARYPKFAEKAFEKVDCKKKTVTTYVNSGAAGCDYGSGTYRWQDGELVPVRLETQETTSVTNVAIRSIETWVDGKHSVKRRRIIGENCHLPEPRDGLNPLQITD
jgi:hypothetical protein